MVLMAPIDWAYIFQPNLDVFRHPFPALIGEVRAALGRIKQGGTALESQWANPAKRSAAEPR